MRAENAAVQTPSRRSRGGLTAPTAPLPRGRHGISPERIAANQRERLLRAAAEIFAEQGYASLAVRTVIERARVSRATFYKLFEDKLDCLLAAQQSAYGALEDAIAPSCVAGPHWPSGVVAAVGAALDFAARCPVDARLLLASSPALSEPRLAREGLVLQEKLAALLHAGAERCPSARSPAPFAERAAVGAAISIIAGCFAAEEPLLLPDLKVKVAQILLTPYLGAIEADRVALAHSPRRRGERFDAFPPLFARTVRRGGRASSPGSYWGRTPGIRSQALCPTSASLVSFGLASLRY